MIDEYDHTPQAHCKHASCFPKYNDDDMVGLSSHEVRERFPRFYGTCPDCWQTLVGYSSYYHYIAGDW